jgi:hypothetical protein
MPWYNTSMETDFNELAGGEHQPKPSPRHKSGCFLPGDSRINRRGRPKGYTAAARRAAAGKSLSGRIQCFLMPDLYFRVNLARINGPAVVNLPRGFKVVACQPDVARGGFLVTIFSETFPMVREGQRIPEFVPEFNGTRFASESALNC